MLYRLLTLIIKELQSLLRVKQTRFMLIMPVVLQVCLFPFAATLDVNNITVAIYNEDNGANSVELTQRIAAATAVKRIRLLSSSQQIQPVIDDQEALLVVRFPADFSRHLAEGRSAKLQLLLDGRRSNSAQIAANYIQQITQTYAQQIATTTLPVAVSNTLNANQLEVRNWYNPNLNYKWFIVPSLIALITTIGVMTVTSLSVAREREQGTLDQLLVSPLSTGQIFIGKAVPALLVATMQATIILLFGLFLYRIPFAGSLPLYYLLLLVYGCSLVGFGLLISSVSNTQQQAFIGVFIFMMPAILLSGYISPVENMPLWLQHLTWINPIRHFVEITKQIYLKDAGMAVLWSNLWPLLCISVVTITLAWWIFRRRTA
ncbi:MAG: ABC transporter permease [Enterobacteriaceae bacterium]